MKVVVLIVVYGFSFKETASYQSLIGQCDASCDTSIIIWDNSPTASDVNLVGNVVNYIHTPENKSLSSIYNTVIAEFVGENEFLLILDQDTNLPPDYLAKFCEYASKYPHENLFLPLIKTGGNIVSPLSYFFGWGKYWKTWSAGINKANNISAINSGMIISSVYLKNNFKGYDERIKFYGTDTQFMLDYCDHNENYVLMDVMLNHDLSFFSAEESEKVKKFKSMRNAYYYIYKDRSFYQKAMVYFIMFIVSARYALKHKKISYLYLN